MERESIRGFGSETLVGRTSRRRDVGSGSKEGKTWVATAIERGGKILKLERIPNRSAATPSMTSSTATSRMRLRPSAPTDLKVLKLGIAEMYVTPVTTRTVKPDHEEQLGCR